jgi:hypothetical protein
MHKILIVCFLVAVALEAAAAAIPSNCLPCPDECSIICKNLNKDICRVMECITPNSPSTNINDYRLVLKLLPCPNLQAMHDQFCVAGKAPDGVDVVPA